MSLVRIVVREAGKRPAVVKRRAANHIRHGLNWQKAKVKQSQIIARRIPVTLCSGYKPVGYCWLRALKYILEYINNYYVTSYRLTNE